ncbi:hypothetical protein Poli38472_004035 [Pythium oligandrum]|uniref:Protein kinase domain-containing protein n=1 Tax=Pythium oligandrum TaxID=41045 RepID=A0A8K1FJP1_PYTOL|nr:hypothetical protein Poli38472_004035 [Pythium oligandrum]|eukprot:TMW66270.1 hypothetical protein Poli38472_004035 [Pythium oligandrum]
MRLALLMFLVLSATNVVRAEDDESIAPIAALPESPDAEAPEPATVGPIDEVDAESESNAPIAASTTPSSTAAAAPKATPTPSPTFSAHLFDLTRSTSSDANVDILEIVRKDTDQAPSIAFAPMSDKNWWQIDKWDDPIKQLMSTITNEKLDVSDGVKLHVMLQGHAGATKVSFRQSDEGVPAPILVFQDESLAGLDRLMILEFFNFNISFEGAKWLPAKKALSKLTFEKAVMENFVIDSKTEVGDVIIQKSKMEEFPVTLLQLKKPPKTLILEECTFTSPVRIDKTELEKLQKIEAVTLANNDIPTPQGSECEEIVKFKNIQVCIQNATTLESARIPLLANGAESSPLEEISAPQSQLDDSGKMSGSKSSLTTIVAVVCVIGGVVGVLGFIWVRRRPKSESGEADAQLTFSDKKQTFLRDEAPSVAVSVLSDESFAPPPVTDLGCGKVKTEAKLGVNGMWRAEYRRDPVVALKVHMPSLAIRKHDFETIAASFTPLQHPNITKFLGTSFISSDDALLVVEYMEKGSLLSAFVAHQGELSWEKRHEMSLQIVSGLAFAHSARPGLLAQNLSSRSVLCDNEMNCKIDIFDYADSTRDHRAPAVTYGLGEVAYRAPELLRGEPMSRAAEVYALGVIFCELSMLGPVYQRITDEQGHALGDFTIARDVLAGRLHPEPAWDTPEDFRDIILACVEFEPSKRPSVPEIVKWLRARYSVS